MDNNMKLKQLKQLDVDKITEIKMTSIGLLDIFGKLNIEIQTDTQIEEIEFISPVPIEEISEWLEKKIIY